jgi:hypothetical protein
MARELLGRKRESTDNDSTIMDAFSPELAEHWLAGQTSPADERSGGRSEDSLSPAQQEAWEKLAERVNAARSVY